jgi:hypothetical protein
MCIGLMGRHQVEIDNTLAADAQPPSAGTGWAVEVRRSEIR